MPALSLPIILIGPMGSGKTTVGRHLAQRLEANYVDTDDLFVAEHGHIGQFFTTHGETAFRDNEQQVIAQTLARDDLGVISLGGGAIIRLANREIIRERGYVVFLDVSESKALNRLGDASDRPVLAGDPAGQWSRIRADRLEHFTQSAHQVVDTTGLDVDAVATKIVQGYQSFCQGIRPQL
ncbi:MAG TPA: shikimate kinase [Enteractinococcus helveticum]|uniref:Shikimate kinase n=1 Tax=Enteractinococcus helveticum TaxID=1837282 RepID=A0A921FLS2_9MICC|nr:shikimate kinase [Enteractinococcus helveticum]HJF14125.1 shikimate kinase [Enteractinococcus helveticum]